MKAIEIILLDITQGKVTLRWSGKKTLIRTATIIKQFMRWCYKITLDMNKYVTTLFHYIFKHAQHVLPDTNTYT